MICKLGHNLISVLVITIQSPYTQVTLIVPHITVATFTLLTASRMLYVDMYLSTIQYHSVLFLVNLHHVNYFYFPWLRCFLTASRLYLFDIVNNPHHQFFYCCFLFGIVNSPHNQFYQLKLLDRCYTNTYISILAYN